MFDPYDEGYEDRIAGSHRDENPYTSGTIAYTDWDNGWEEADDDERVLGEETELDLRGDGYLDVDY